MLDIEKTIFSKENRKDWEYDDDIAILFYKGEQVARTEVEKFRKSWMEEADYFDNMCDFLDDVASSPSVDMDDEDYNDNWEHIYDKLTDSWDEKEKCCSYGNWTLIVLNI